MLKKKQETKKIRLRFPPSPTGPLHIGNARTILFNYLFAKQNNGETVLRIEDTDKERSKLEWVQNIIDELKWLGIDWSEGPDIDGKFGPYKQSQRTDIYKKYLEKLLSEKKAYYCNCTSEELEAKRQDQQSRGLAPKYDGKCRDKNNISGVIRFKIESKKVKFNDLIRGNVEFDSGLLGDIVIAKNIETPLYHFVVVVDDHEMQISHVIRGEDHLSNTPKHILLQESLGFNQPEYAHLPLLLNADKSKMSKRAGDVAVSDYHKAGYLSEALINFMALLGWNPGTEKEIFSMKELINEFSLEKVQKAGAVFNTQKLDHINGLYIREMPAPILTKLCLEYLPEDHKNFSQKTLEKIVEVSKTRMKKLSDITELTNLFFEDNLIYEKDLLKWKEMKDADIKEALLLCDKELSSAKKWDAKNLEKILFEASEKFNREKGYPVENKGYTLWPLRVALSGKKASPGPFEIAEILGKEKTLERIKQAL
ncbi:MAG: glutamate--tRNA ligase [Candidatus Staskawiczbacteria bacterium]|nr:glutamate--tRNA ligase [Candidatus Staskawiczbacteria bacterium]